jgi:5-methylcytosine-specific restriction endonuclease McrA
MARKKPLKIVWAKTKRKQFSKKVRQFVFERDGYACQLCHKDLKDLPKERVLDHIIPLKQLGTNRLDNIWLLCESCDKKKKDSVLPVAVNKRLDYLKHYYNLK